MIGDEISIRSHKLKSEGKRGQACNRDPIIIGLVHDLQSMKGRLENGEGNERWHCVTPGLVPDSGTEPSPIRSRQTCEDVDAHTLQLQSIFGLDNPYCIAHSTAEQEHIADLREKLQIESAEAWRVEATQHSTDALSLPVPRDSVT